MPNHHEAIIPRADFNAVQKKLQNAKYSTVTFLPSLNVIKEGILKGFVSVHPRWAGFKPEDYYNASRSIYNMAYLEKLYSEDGIEHICKGKDGDFDYRGYEIIRSEFVNQSNHITITFFPKKITFSTEAIRKLPKADYIELLIHPDRQLLAVRPSSKKNKHALSWKILNKRNIKPKAIYGSSFLPSLTELLDWNKENTYKLIGLLKQNNTDSFLLFDLKHPEIVLPCACSDTPHTSSPTIAYPESWAKHFGDDYYLQQSSMKLNHEDENWNSQTEGIPYATEDMKDITGISHLKSQIEEITRHLSSQEEQHG